VFQQRPVITLGGKRGTEEDGQIQEKTGGSQQTRGVENTAFGGGRRGNSSRGGKRVRIQDGLK